MRDRGVYPRLTMRDRGVYARLFFFVCPTARSHASRSFNSLLGRLIHNSATAVVADRAGAAAAVAATSGATHTSALLRLRGTGHAHGRGGCPLAVFVFYSLRCFSHFRSSGTSNFFTILVVGFIAYAFYRSCISPGRTGAGAGGAGGGGGGFGGGNWRPGGGGGGGFGAGGGGTGERDW